MKIDLAIAGRGAVTPAGIGIDALTAGHASPTMIEEVRRPGQAWPVLRVNLKDPAFARWQREPRLRRASAITFFLVEAAAQALGNASTEERARTGLVVAFSAGCLAYSRRFYEQIVKEGQRAASPALFPETVFNSPVSHVVTVLGLNGAAYALVGDESAWISALLAASIWLKKGRVEQVLILGAEEFDPLVLDTYRSARWLRRGDSGKGFLTSEGAAGILVRDAGEADAPVITTARDGLIHRTRAEAGMAATEVLKHSDPATPVFRSAQRNWAGPFESNAVRDRPLVRDVPYLGEAFTASAAWRTIQAASLLGTSLPRLQMPVWGLNYQFGSLELAVGK